MGVVSPALSKKMPSPFVELTGVPSSLSDNDNVPSGLGLTKCEVGNLSSASANHCCSLPNLQSRRKDASIPESIMVNHAPTGTLVSAEDRKAPSIEAMVRNGRRTR